MDGAVIYEVPLPVGTVHADLAAGTPGVSQRPCQLGGKLSVGTRAAAWGTELRGKHPCRLRVHCSMTSG